MIAIECKNPTIAEHILYFLNSLPKKDVTVTISDDFYTQAQKNEIQKRRAEIKHGVVKTINHEECFSGLV
jgi:hypothetical protein